MSINKSQQFLYFQNKARHYQNIRKAKPHIDDHLENQYRHTIDHSTNKSNTNTNQKIKKNNKLEPYLKMYNIHVDNQHLINRLVNIAKSSRTQVQAQGTYSRFNKVQRQFRNKNPYRDQTQRKISLQNQELINRIDKTKPVIGSTIEWSNDYKKRLSLRKNMSRYQDSQTSKGSLHLSTSRFMPEHYKSYIFKLDGEEIQKKGQTITIISKQKLTKLPRILYNNKSNSILHSDKSQKDLQLI